MFLKMRDGGIVMCWKYNGVGRGGLVFSMHCVENRISMETTCLYFQKR
jgi:hypothetical protein